MKKLITFLLFTFASINCYSQEFAEKVANKFYSIIDSSGRMDCCEKVSGGLTINYSYSTFELPIQSNGDIIKQYYSQIMDSVIIDEVVKDLVKSYTEVPSKYKSKITKTCFGVRTKTNIEQKNKNGLYFATGKVQFSFSFQIDDPIKRNIFKRMFNIF